VTSLYHNVISGGILIGVIYALIALGLTIIFGVMRLVNFAHGEMVVIGMYAGYALWSATGLPPWTLAPVAASLLFAMGYLLQRAIINAFIDRPQHAQFILFIALALIITGLSSSLLWPRSAADPDGRKHAVLCDRSDTPRRGTYPGGVDGHRPDRPAHAVLEILHARGVDPSRCR
jgi:branched-subunit amino acid ABC-type transport system permease component